MRTYFRSLSDVLGSPLAQTAQTFSPRHAGGHRVLKSTKLEDAAYRDLRRGDNELDALEKACGEKLSPPMRPLRNLSVRWLETWMSCWKKPVEKKGR